MNKDRGFLVLERKVNQSIIIETSDGDVEVMICAVKIEEGKPDRVKVGISAPQTNGIVRKEIA